MECETQETEARHTKHYNLYSPEAYMCGYRVIQNIILSLYSVVIG